MNELEGYPRIHSLIWNASFFKPSEQDLDIVLLADLVMAVLSILGCIFNFMTALLLKTNKIAIGKMVLGLSVMDFVSSVVVIVLRQRTNEYVCRVETFFLYFGYAGSFAWTCCFANALYKAIKSEDFEVIDAALVKNYTKLSIILALLIAVYSTATGFRKTQDGLCLPQDLNNQSNANQLIIVTVPCLISIVYCLYCYMLVMKKLKNVGTFARLELLVYPLILILCTLPTTLMELLLFIKSDMEIPFWWFLMSYSLFVGQGFFNAIVYGLSKKVIDGYKALCCRRSSVHNQELLTQNDTSVRY